MLRHAKLHFWSQKSQSDLENNIAIEGQALRIKKKQYPRMEAQLVSIWNVFYLHLSKD